MESIRPCGHRSHLTGFARVSGSLIESANPAAASLMGEAKHSAAAAPVTVHDTRVTKAGVVTPISTL